MLIKNAKAFINGEFRENTDIVISEGKVAAIGQGLMVEGAETIDLKGDLLLPGFVGVHIHAFMGQDTMNRRGKPVRHMSRELKKFGVARIPAHHHECQARKIRRLRSRASRR